MPRVDDSQKVGVTYRSMRGGRKDIDHQTRLKPDQFSSMKNGEIRNTGLARTRRGSNLRATGGSGTVQGVGFFEKSPLNAFCMKVQGGVPYLWANSGAAWDQIGGVTLPNTDQPISIVPGVVEGVSGLSAMFFQGAGSAVAYWNGDPSANIELLGIGDTDPPPVNFVVAHPCGRLAGIGHQNLRDHVLFSGLFEHGNGQWDASNFIKRIFTGDGEPVAAIANYRKNEMLAWTANSTHLLGNLNDASATNFTRETLDDKIGIRAPKSALVTGEDGFFMSQDRHIRTIKRTPFDVAYGVSTPITSDNHQLVSRINQTKAHLCAATVFDNYAIFAVPMDSSAYNNSCIVFDLMHYTQLPNGGVAPICIGEWTGWNVFDWINASFSNQQRLFWVDSQSGALFEALVGENEGTAYPVLQFELRGEDFDLPGQEKTLRDGWVKYEQSSGSMLIEIKDERGDYQTVETITADANHPAFDMVLDFAFGTPITLQDPFYFFGYGRSRWWQMRITCSNGPWNIREIDLNGFVENEKTGIW